MSLTRSDVLKSLREFGHPVTAVGLAAFMNSRPGAISTLLSTLYFKDQVDRLPAPGRAGRWVYLSKALAS